VLPAASVHPLHQGWLLRRVPPALRAVDAHAVYARLVENRSVGPTIELFALKEGADCASGTSASGTSGGAAAGGGGVSAGASAGASAWQALPSVHLQKAHEWAGHSSAGAGSFITAICCRLVGQAPSSKATLPTCIEVVGAGGSVEVLDAGDEENMGEWLDAIAAVIQPSLLSGGGTASERMRLARGERASAASSQSASRGGSRTKLLRPTGRGSVTEVQTHSIKHAGD